MWFPKNTLFASVLSKDINKKSVSFNSMFRIRRFNQGNSFRQCASISIKHTLSNNLHVIL